ncbi:MAG: SPASM domain-containing protein, partial [Deltaproteobacteria bacterium]|nr:SPASM domain-containing protein [Deltaproteobacteria bacterium]
ADYDRVLTNIRKFLEIKKASGRTKPYTVIQVIKEYDSKNQEPGIGDAFKALFAGLPVDLFNPIVMQSFAGHLKDSDIRHIPYTGKYTPCPQIWKRFVVGWDGRAIACCVDLNAENVVGDAKLQSLMDIWNGKEFRGLREKIAKGDYKDLPACSHCDFLWREYKEKKGSALKRMAKKIVRLLFT